MFTGTLKPYQVEAVERMAHQKKMLVAYEMGLGKTCMTIAALEELRERKEIVQPTLVIVLASLKYQWEAEITKFSNATVTVVDGSKDVRTRQYVDGTYTDYIVTNYESIVNDWDLLKGFVV
jgi:SNF2 family DNA or RNA helicase